MGCIPAPSCKAALVEATELWPARSRAADGICASAAHHLANPTSDHEKGEAFDLTHDPGNGCDAHHLAELLAASRDPRVKYIISRRRIWSTARADEGWRPYTGADPHTGHAHISINHDHRATPGAWWAPLLEEDDMTDAERKMLAELHNAVVGKGAPAFGLESVLVASNRAVYELHGQTLEAKPHRSLFGQLVDKISGGR